MKVGSTQTGGQDEGTENPLSLAGASPPSGWSLASFDQSFTVISTTNSKIAQTDYKSQGIFPVIDQGQEPIGGYTDDARKLVGVEPPAIVFGDHTRAVKLVDVPFAVGADGTKVLKPSNRVLPAWTFYYLLSLRLPDKGYSRHFRFLRQADIPLAPLAEQRRIVAAIEAHFTRLDAAVAALQRAQANLQRYRASVLKAACEGKLVPTEAHLAQAEGRDYEPADVLLERILAERQTQWQAANPRKKYKPPTPPDTTNLPPLPEGWTWVPFDILLLELKNGYFRGRPQDDETAHPILRISAVRPMSVDLSERVYLADIDESAASRYYVEDGDLLFTRYNGTVELVGACALVSAPPNRLLYPDKLIRARVVDEIVRSDYLEVYFSSEIGRSQIRAKIRSTAGQHGISGTSLKSIPVALPPMAEQARICDALSPLLSNMSSQRQMIELNQKRADRLRQSILERAFTGRLVPQDPNDEPAAALLARIQTERNGESVQPSLPFTG